VVDATGVAAGGVICLILNMGKVVLFIKIDTCLDLTGGFRGEAIDRIGDITTIKTPDPLSAPRPLIGSVLPNNA
jgi:hypothetical protein